MKIETVPIDSLILDPENARVHPADNVLAIQASLSRFGQVVPLVVRDGVVIGGNATYAAARGLHWTQVQVVLFGGTKSEATALAIALNRTAELAQWDVAQLTASLAELSEITALELGFSAADLDALLPPVAIVELGEKKPPEIKIDPHPVAEMLQYVVLFDTEAQQTRFFELLARLKEIYPDANNAAARLVKLADDLV